MYIITLEGKIGSIKNKWLIKISMHFITSFFWMKNTQHFCRFFVKLFITKIFHIFIRYCYTNCINSNMEWKSVFGIVGVVIALESMTLMTAWYFQHWSIHAAIEWTLVKMIHINFPKVLRIPNFSTITNFDASCIEAENDELKRVQTINHFEKKNQVKFQMNVLKLQ